MRNFLLNGKMRSETGCETEQNDVKQVTKQQGRVRQGIWAGGMGRDIGQRQGTETRAEAKGRDKGQRQRTETRAVTGGRDRYKGSAGSMNKVQ